MIIMPAIAKSAMNTVFIVLARPGLSLFEFGAAFNDDPYWVGTVAEAGFGSTNAFVAVLGLADEAGLPDMINCFLASNSSCVITP